MEPIDPAAPTQIVMDQVQLVIGSTGRAVMMAFPRDLTDAELFEVVAWLANPEGLRLAVTPKSPIITARGLVGLPS